jgi:O-antigen biosynthesis protein
MSSGGFDGWRHLLYQADHQSRSIFYAIHVLREEGPRGILTRVQRKLRRFWYRPAISYDAPLAPIGPLTLETCPPTKIPRVSIVIPTYGQHHHTFNCLRSLQQHTHLADVEIVVIDDASPDPLAAALDQVAGARFVRNEQNFGFIGSCRQGTALARGEYLVLLNNDVRVTKGWLESLLDVFRLRADAGAVGARLVYPDGRLQEAGGIVWNDGTACNYGHGDDPERPPYRYLRPVDYCSGACLAVRRDDWEALGGFDSAFAPAYYEDTDLACRVRQAGKRVYYQPEALIVHYEGISSGTDTSKGVKQHQVINQRTFVDRWRPALGTHGRHGTITHAEADRRRPRVLIVEAAMLTPDQDSGSRRLLSAMELLLELGCSVTFVADGLQNIEPYAHRLRQAGIQFWHWPYFKSVFFLLEALGAEYDVIVFCRHYVAARFLACARRYAPQAKIVFDTVDLHYLREERRAEIEASPIRRVKARVTRSRELAMIAKADTTIVVSPLEQSLLKEALPQARVHVVSNIHEPQDGGHSFGQRSGLLFVGGFRHAPNVDAVRWFLGEVWPILRARLPDLKVTVVGSRMPAGLKELAGPGIDIRGFVSDITPLLRSSRVSIAPLRYGAGVKGKVNEAMAWGLPVVATPTAAEGMGVVDERHLLLADTAEDFARAVYRLHTDEALWTRLAEGGRENVRQNFSRDKARTALRALLDETLGRK